MRTLLLHSSSAGDGGPSRDGLLEIFRQAGCEPFSCAVNGTDFSDALCRPADLVVAVGGDGVGVDDDKSVSGSLLAAVPEEMGQAHS